MSRVLICAAWWALSLGVIWLVWEGLVWLYEWDVTRQLRAGGDPPKEKA